MKEIIGTIKAISVKNVTAGQIGFMIEEMDGWYNLDGEEETLREILKNVISKGNKVKYEANNGIVGNLELVEKAPETSSDMIKISGKDYMLYTGLLKRAHEAAEYFSMEITDSHVSEDMKMAWCKVKLTAMNKEGFRVNFDGFGSSTPENASAIGSSHPVEMAHTRAKGRALRDFLNIGEVMAEELAK